MLRLELRIGAERVVVPAKFAGGLEEGCPVRVFAGRDIARRDRIFSHLASGGIAVVSGLEAALNELLSYVQRRSADLKPRSEMALDRLMVLARNSDCEGIEPLVHIAYLSEFCGEALLAKDQAFLIPLTALRNLQDGLAQKWHVDALGTWLTAGNDVIPPKSQETVGLFQEAIAAQKLCLPHGAQILDMGCGSGVLALLAAILLEDLKPRVTATDVMPETTASTRLNVAHFTNEGLITSDTVEVLRAGDIFEPVGDASFDLIIFNAPWVVAQVSSRADISLNDPKQKTIARFLRDAPSHLASGGRIILGYADNSGQKAVDRVLEMAEKAGLRMLKERSVRVQTHRKKRKWQRIYVWEMGRIAD